MKKSNSFKLRDHLKTLISKNGIFNKVFSNLGFSDFLATQGIEFRKRALTPDLLLWGFMNQVLDDDHSCRTALATIIAKLKAEGKKIISSSTGAYCQARSKLPEIFFSDLGRFISRKLDEKCTGFTWKGFEVKLVDGSDLKMPITKENKKEYSAAANSTGLLKCRILGIFSLSHGGILDLAIGPFKGKGTGEVTLLRSLYHCFKEGELLIADRLFCSFFDMANFIGKKVEFVMRKHGSMKSNFKKGIYLGKNDHIIELQRPWNRTDSIVTGEIKKLPKTIKIREVKILVANKGFRVKEVFLLTSLLDPLKYTKNDLAELYYRRWNVEVDLRSIKTHLKMDVLRCKSPSMIRKEIWMHMITYNYLRAIMYDGAVFNEVTPREISFKETLQLVKAFRPYQSIANKKERVEIYLTILESLKDRVGNRPGRIEPRLVRNNTMRFGLLKKSRKETRTGFWKTGWAWKKRKEDLSAVA